MEFNACHNFENIMLRHKEPHIICFHLYDMSRISKSIELGNMLVVPGAGMKKKWKLNLNGEEVSF